MPSTDYSSGSTVNDLLFYESNKSTLTASHQVYVRTDSNGNHGICIYDGSNEACLQCETVDGVACGNYYDGSVYDIESIFTNAGISVDGCASDASLAFCDLDFGRFGCFASSDGDFFCDGSGVGEGCEFISGSAYCY